ncbi:hypothetical protein TB2_024023 [Malus domestica]
MITVRTESSTTRSVCPISLKRFGATKSRPLPQNCITNSRLVLGGAVLTSQPIDPFIPLSLGNLPPFEELLRRPLLEVVRKDLTEQWNFRGTHCDGRSDGTWLQKPCESSLLLLTMF